MFFVQNLINVHQNTQDFDFIQNHKGKLIIDGTLIALIVVVAGLILGRVIPLPIGVGALTDKFIYGVLACAGFVAVFDGSSVLKHLINSPYTKDELAEHYFDAFGNEYTLKEMAFGFRTAKGFNRTVAGGYITASNPAFSAKYKVHLTPKPEDMQRVVSLLVERIAKDGELKQSVAQYQVLLGEKNLEDEVVLPDTHDPRIVIYAESQESFQLILDKLSEAFPDPETLGAINSIENIGAEQGSIGNDDSLDDSNT